MAHRNRQRRLRRGRYWIKHERRLSEHTRRQTAAREQTRERHVRGHGPAHGAGTQSGRQVAVVEDVPPSHSTILLERGGQRLGYDIKVDLRLLCLCFRRRQDKTDAEHQSTAQPPSAPDSRWRIRGQLGSSRLQACHGRAGTIGRLCNNLMSGRLRYGCSEHAASCTPSQTVPPIGARHEYADPMRACSPSLLFGVCGPEPTKALPKESLPSPPQG